jgi:membrane associated rhomboid family serine protease
LRARASEETGANVGVPSLLGIEQSVAWQAHIGGFLAGLILFALFEPMPPRSEIETSERT